MSDVQVVGFDLEGVRRQYGFTDWPNGLARINLGERSIDVIPTPGHNETEVFFYDGSTGLFFSGDFLMPGRLLVDDANAYLTSAKRVAAFVSDRPVSVVLAVTSNWIPLARRFRGNRNIILTNMPSR